METHLNNKSIPSLCFNREDFMAKAFSVNKFVSEYRKYAHPLETIREDLNILHKKLCTAMVELINEDYAVFVNLSSNLVGLDKSIKNLTLPLQSLRNEVDKIKMKQDETLDAANNLLHERASSHASKVLMHHVWSVFEGLIKIEQLRSHNKENNSLETLERIAFTFNTVEFHLTKISESDINEMFPSNEAVKISKSIESKLENVFLQSLQNSNIENLEKVLRIYAIISSENKVEHCFRCKVVRPFMKNVINQSSVTKWGLVKVYNDVLSFIPKCHDILKITSSSETEGSISGYDFLVNAVWPEIISCFQYISPVYVYSIGDPVLFQENYTATMNFLDEFEHECKLQSSVKRLRKHASYKDFIGKFNLDVYFEIRFQEIASYLEEKLEEFFVKSDGTTPYILSATHSVYTCLELCWNKSYLPPLKTNFCKLFLQLLSRYKKWADSSLMSVKENGAVAVAMLIKDVEFLVAQVKIMLCETVYPKLSNELEDNWFFFQDAFDEAMKSLEEVPHYAGKLIVNLLTEKCSNHLKLIANIPQRYRKTNREIPSKPSSYVSEVLCPLTEFLLETNFLSLEWRKYCELEITDGIMKKCISSMKDVLTSIKKMEDSLKILKRARDKPSGQFSSGAITDDDKIRRQLAIDVSYFEELILKSGLQTSNLKTLKELKELVKSAERVPGLSVNS